MSAYSDAILAHGSLVSYWRLGESAGPNAADSKGVNTGTYVGSPTFSVAGPPGAGGSAVTFNGSTQYITVPDHASLDLGNTATMELWLKRAVTGTRQVFFTKGNAAYDISIETNNRANLNSANTAGIMAATVAGAITDTTTWHHILIAKNGATSGLIAIDGVDRSGPFTESAWVNTASALLLGAQDPTPNQSVNGTMAELALYSTALTITDALAHYNLGKTDASTKPALPGMFSPLLVAKGWF